LKEADKYKILVVDDSQLSIEQIFELLRKSGYLMDSAGNGQSALEKLDKEEFDLVLLDVMMPLMDGYEVCRIIKNNPRTAGIPVIFITAKNDNEHIVKGFEAGAVDYVTKPFHKGELIMRVKTHVELVRSKKELEIARDMAQGSSRTKSEFLANMSHEIRTPLYGITGMIDLLRMTQLTAKQREYTDIMMLSAGTLLTLINDILDFSKIEAGELQFESTPFDLRKNISNIISILYPKAEEKGLVLKSHTDINIPHEVTGDPTRLNQVVLNLAANAIKFTNKGSVLINARLHENHEESVVVLIEIIDTGIGIARHNMDKLFRTFSQIDASTTREHGGTGLGLVISKKLTEMMDGTIGVESELGKGSRFWFTCRLHKSRKEKIRLQEAGRKVEKKKLECLNILLAEDNPVNTKVVQFFLYKMGQKVDVAENGIIAVDKFKNGNYDLILMDINMPEMDGFEATRLIRQMEEESGRNVRTRIVAMTANAMTGDREKCMETGMDDYISKPFKPSEMERILLINTNPNI
jgi:two-component system, sensor histidine kinase